MKSKFLMIFAIVVTTSSFFNTTSALNGAQEAGRVVLRDGQRVVHPTIEFPYTAMLEHRGKFTCGAVIITLKTVLTAAHCVKGIPGKQFLVRAGTFTKLDKVGKYVQTRRVERKVVPTEYNKKTLRADIALLKLKMNWIFNEFVKPAQLPRYVSGEPYKNKEFVALGHGYNNYAVESKTLRKAIFKVLSRDECLILQPDAAESVLCVVGQDGMRGANFGDSGSPLIAHHNSERPQHDVVIGITSYIWETDDKAHSAYTNVAYYLDWIKGELF